MYEFKRYEYDLTEEEQEQARFIVETSIAKLKERSEGLSGQPRVESGAFESFRFKFYSAVTRRLRLPYFNETYSLSDDAKKLIHITVERVEP